MSEHQKPDKADGALAFQTMADALHLQKSVIGERRHVKFLFLQKQDPYKVCILCIMNNSQVIARKEKKYPSTVTLCYIPLVNVL